MSKSLKRVRKALEDAGITPDIREMSEGTRTAAAAAAAVGCEIDQIAKSIIFRGETSGDVYLFVTAGGNQVDKDKASRAVDEPLGKADAAQIRTITGFAIGGVAPIGHLNPIRAFWDSRLSEFDAVWAAAGTPRHIFSIDPNMLQRTANATKIDFLMDGEG